MLINYFIATICCFFALNSIASEGDGLPTQLGSYKDPRSSKRHVVCSDLSRKERFTKADVVFFGKFIDRQADLKRRVFKDKYRIIHAWKGSAKDNAEIEVEVPPKSDFCTTPMSNRYDGAPNAGGSIVYAKGSPFFIDCCMVESNELALRDKEELSRLDAEFAKLSGEKK